MSQVFSRLTNRSLLLAAVFTAAQSFTFVSAGNALASHYWCQPSGCAVKQGQGTNVFTHEGTAYGISFEFTHSDTGYDLGGGSFRVQSYTDSNGWNQLGVGAVCWGLYWVVDSTNGSNTQFYTTFQGSPIESSHGASPSKVVGWAPGLYPSTEWGILAGLAGCSGNAGNLLNTVWEL
jgi:hypothetical protein